MMIVNLTRLPNPVEFDGFRSNITVDIEQGKGTLKSAISESLFSLSGVYRKDAVAKPYATRLCWFLWGKFPFCNSNPQHLVLTDE